MSFKFKFGSSINVSVWLLVLGCNSESGTRADAGGDTSALNNDPGSYLRYRVRAETAEARCNRKVTQIAEFLAAAGQRSPGRPELTAGREGLMLAARGQERFYCYLPSGQAEFFDIARMAAVDAPVPSRDEFMHAAESVREGLAHAGLLQGAEVGTSHTSFAEFQTGNDEPDLGISTEETTGARVIFRRELDGLPVLGNFVAVRLDRKLGVVSLKLAWTDVEQGAEEVPTSLTLDQALEEFRASNSNREPKRITGFLAAGLLESQDYLEPWHVFSVTSNGALVFARPAIPNLAPLKPVGVVETTPQQRH